MRSDENKRHPVILNRSFLKSNEKNTVKKIGYLYPTKNYISIGKLKINVLGGIEIPP